MCVGEVRDNYLRRRYFAVRREIVAFRITCSATHGERYASIMDLRVRRS